MKLVIDQYIPLIDELFGQHFEVIKVAPTAIIPSLLKDADILICRSVTQVNAALLTNTAVKFVGTTTSGFDHLDTTWLDEHHIAWRAAVGCNALAVAEYVVACVAYFRKQQSMSPGVSTVSTKKGFEHLWSANQALAGSARRAIAQNIYSKTFSTLRAGIIGVGHVGQLVAEKLKILGFEIVLNDPPRAAQDPNFHSTPLTEFQDLDLICIHTPLTKSGNFPTHHMINKEFLLQQKPDCVLLNAGRGGVIDTQTLLHNGKHLQWCLDVYENEPYPNLNIIQHALINTPHIAGHSIQAKWRGSEMIYQQLMSFLNRSAEIKPIKHYPIARPTVDLSQNSDINSWEDVVLALYNPTEDSRQMRDYLLRNPQQGFSELRNHYRIRHEFAYVDLELPKSLLVSNINKFIIDKLITAGID